VPGGSEEPEKKRANVSQTPCGDVNLYLIDEDGADDDGEDVEGHDGSAPTETGVHAAIGNGAANGNGTANGSSEAKETAARKPRKSKGLLAEIEVMVAVSDFRRRGIAGEAVSLLMGYAAKSLGIGRFRAKIIEKNPASLNLFRKLGFREICRKPVFGEIWLQKDV